MNPDPVSASTALVQRAPDAPNAWDDLILQQLWLATQRREWRSLALVGASKSVDTLWIAELLAKLAWWYRGQPSCVFDLRDLSLRLVEYHQNEVTAQVGSGNCVIVALRSIFENPTAVPIARAADAVVLCVSLGKTDFKAAEQTIAELGRDRVIGSIVVRKPSKKRPGNGKNEPR